MNEGNPVDEYRLLVKIDELKRQLRALAEENAALRYERDVARADVRALLPQATPEEEEEMRRLMATAVPGGLERLITELEAEGGEDGRR